MLITPTILVVATVGGHRAWEWQAERRLERFVQGLRDSGQPVSMTELLPEQPLPDAVNGAVDLRVASDNVVLDEAWQQLFNIIPVALPLADHEVETLRSNLKTNRGPLAKVREAMDKPSMDWNGVIPQPPRMMSPWGGRGMGFFRQRGVSQLLYGAVLLAHHEKDDATALDRVDELIFLAESIGKRPTVRSQIASLRLYDVAHRALDEVQPDLLIGEGPGRVPASRVRALCVRLMDAEPARQSMVAFLQAERARHLDFARGIDPLAGRDPSSATAMDLSAWGEPLPMPYPGSSLERTLTRPVYIGRVQQSLERLQLAIDSFDEPAYRGFLAEFPEVGGDHPDGDEGDKALRQLTDQITQIGRTYYTTLARGRASAMALSVQLYRAEHAGQWPTPGAKVLIPNYLLTLPGDPLATSGEPLVYLPSERRPRVYSVGDDGIDDGGFPPDPYAQSLEDLRMTDYVVDLVRQPRPRPRG